MNISLVKKPEDRIEQGYSQSLGIVSFGGDNLYPQQLRRLILSSSTGASCVERRAIYIQGGGFRDENLGTFRCNFLGDTLNDVLAKLSKDYASYDGFAIHLNYNVLGYIVSIEFTPFENCRHKEPDSKGYVSKIAIHPDWESKKTFAGQKIQVSKDNIDFIDIFNPNPKVVQQQIIAAGGIEKYKGQIIYFSNEGRNSYPIPKADKAITDMSSDEGLSNISNRNIRNNFFPAGMVITKRGQSVPDSTDTSEAAIKAREEADEKFDRYVETFARLQGDMNAGKLINVEIETDEDKPSFETLEPKNFDKDFTVTTPEVEARIYAAFNQELFWRMRQGSIGFSGEIMNDLKKEYCEQVSIEQRSLAQTFSKILSHWNPSNLPAFSTTEIKPLIESL